MKSQIIRTIVLTLIFVSFISCNNEKEKPTVEIIKKEYIPSKDSNNVFYQRRLAEFEGGMMIRNYMVEIDSLYKIGQYKNFDDIEYNIYNTNKSLDSTINYYIKIFGNPFYNVKYDDHSTKQTNKGIVLRFYYNEKYFLSINIMFYKPKINEPCTKITTTNIRKFLFFPRLESWEPFIIDTSKPIFSRDYKTRQNEIMLYKNKLSMDSVLRLIQSRKKK